MKVEAVFEVELTEDQKKQIAIDYLKSLMPLGFDSFILREYFLYGVKDYGSSFNAVKEEKLREACLKDKYIINALTLLEEGL